MTQQPDATVFIVDDDDDFRDSMQWLLESDGLGVRSFASAESFLEHYTGAPGCMLLDVRMPTLNGLALQQIMQERGIALPLIVISGHGDIPMAVTAIKNGAMDFLEKPFDDATLLHRVREGLAQAQSLQQQQKQLTELRSRHETLSRREKQVMELVVAGMANREIAEDLGISPKTVEVHRSRVMSKMQADSLPELVNMAGRLDG
ncbi:DNA-binding response regulator [Marinobacterium nitratireducens]|uniref:DNA-binding response regulator n=1 Tax=Marinobacterium nitratireducens TaxID=518897 RepID=A0A917ZDB0_9GAMM|nr:response regulator [Marinobacterium nitratireducens]GGO81318.1 DNA-binding response regulator [Marinobacterium nitratireducens]